MPTFEIAFSSLLDPRHIAPIGFIVLNERDRIPCSRLAFDEYERPDTRRGRERWNHLVLRVFDSASRSLRGLSAKTQNLSEHGAPGVRSARSSSLARIGAKTSNRRDSSA